MHSFFLLQCLLGASSPVFASLQHPVQWVESVVSSMTSEFLPAVTYAGPTGTVSAASNMSTTRIRPLVAAATPTATIAPYWLEQIKHQGIAAFNPSPSSYQVFRNVKDFGAKGPSRNFGQKCSILTRMWSQEMESQMIRQLSTQPLAPGEDVHLEAATPRPPHPQLCTFQQELM